MIRARSRALLIAAATVIAACGFAFGLDRSPPSLAARAAAERPPLLLLTALPLVFGETFGIEGGGSPALTALETRYRVTPISLADAASLRSAQLLLMAQPLAQPAETLVELDAWVRNGGQLLLLADPALDWPSKRPLGDPLRPPPMFGDTGLLGHWGLRLDAPIERGPVAQQIGRRSVLTASPGALFGRCAINGDRLVAHCRVGAGHVTVIADADFLNVAALDGSTKNNLDAMLAELAELENH